jgi:hypothetical protein
MGPAEVRNLMGEHVDVRRYALKLRRQKTGKTYEVLVFDAATRFLWNLLQSGSLRPGKPVFSTHKPGKHLSRRADVWACHAMN